MKSAFRIKTASVNMIAKSLDQYIESQPNVCGGKPCIAGRRIRVYDVVVWHEQMKMTIAEIATDFDLTPQEIYAALAYYHEHREEINARMAEDDRLVEEIKQKYPSELQQRLDERKR
jgi:uncharacterized protein (DUF433 family)